MVDKRIPKKKEEKVVDLSDDRVLKILYRECRKVKYPCRLGKTGLFVGSAQEGLGASAAIDSCHLHLFRKGAKLSALAAFLGKDIGRTGESRNEKLHENVADFDEPPTGIPESLQEVSAYIGTLLAQIESGEIASDDDD